MAIVCLTGMLAHAEDDASLKLFEIHSRLAAKGSSEAQFKLGEMCEEGRGTPRDLAKAREWYELAAGQGHEEAKMRLTTLGQRQPRGDTAKMEQEAQLIKAREEEAHQAALAKKREEEERRQAVERRRAEEERERLARQRGEAERLRQIQAQQSAEEERARKAELQRKQDEERARTALKVSPAAAQATPVVAPPESGGAPAATPPAGSDSKQESFESDPCKGPAARFMSTCR
ncbi:MAG TPA: hypothetical protein VGE00_04105 [Gammaproteobacteria bacterium]